MNMTMQQQQRPQFPYPYYIRPQHQPLPIPWSSIPSQPLSSFIYPQQNNQIPRTLSSSYSNRRYNNLKQLNSYPIRRPIHRSIDASTQPYRYSSSSPHDLIHSNQNQLSRTKSLSSNHIPKAHSWHMMNHNNNNYQKNLSKKKKKYIQSQKPISPLPKRRSSFRTNQKKRLIKIPEPGIVRISTLDEMPIINNQRTNSINTDRSSTKGSLSNSSKRQIKSKGNNNSIKNRKIINNSEPIIESDTSSSSSTNSSFSSLQQRLNGSLRNDPLIIAAMEDFRQFRRTSIQSRTLARPNQHLSHDSLCSDSTLHSSSRSRSQSQSSFTSIERSEIRQLIQSVKTKPTTPLTISLSSSPIPQRSLSINSSPSTPKLKPKKSLITEELDREFNKLRERNPNHELSYVTPSSISKRTKPIEIPSKNLPPSPTLDELLRQVQLRPINKLHLKEETFGNNYENPLPFVPVPRCSPIPSREINPIEGLIHEYATPIKKPAPAPPPPPPPPPPLPPSPPPQVSQFQPNHNFNPTDITSEKRTSRPLSMFNWFHNNITNSCPTTFQPNRVYNNDNNNQNEYGLSTTINENIYTSEYLPLSIDEKFEDNLLQIHLDNQTILTDHLYSDYQIKPKSKNSSSILNDLSYLFTRKHKQENKLNKKTQRCSIM